MFRKAAFLGLMGMWISTGWSDETVPPRPSAAVRQRVDPKLLREALALPEYQEKANESTAELLGELQKLSDKLRESGDNNAADLLGRFISEHQRLVNQSQQRDVDVHKDQYLVMRVVQVNLDRLPKDSVLLRESLLIGDKSLAESSKIIAEEIDHLIEAKLARALIEPALRVRSDGAVHQHPAHEFPLAISNKAMKFDFREQGILIAAIPTRLTEKQIRLESICKYPLNEGRTDVAQGTRKDSFEMNPGETCIQATTTLGGVRERWFVIYSFLPKS